MSGEKDKATSKFMKMLRLESGGSVSENDMAMIGSFIFGFEAAEKPELMDRMLVLAIKKCKLSKDKIDEILN